MILKAIIDDQLFELNVPEAFIAEAADFFDRMDRDMDQGWQMSRDWVESPDRMQRCQIVSNRLLSALEKENHDLGRLMAGYLLSRAPEIEAVEIDTTGDMNATRFSFREASASAEPEPSAPTAPPEGLGKMEAMTRAGQEVSRVFKVGRGWRFSVYDPARDSWTDSATYKTKEEADEARNQAFKRRFDELTARP